jgi:hypothetical protein
LICQAKSRPKISASIISTPKISSAPPWTAALNEKHLLHLVAEVVDDLDADAAMLRLGERARNGRIQLRPCGLVDLSFERPLERIVGIVADEIGLADKKLSSS